MKCSLDLVAEFPRKSSLNGLVLREPIDENLLDKCIASDLLIERYDDDKWFKNEKTHLEKYKKTINRDLSEVQYRFTDNYNFGRVNVVGSLGLHSIRKETRHTLVKDKMVDVDIENAHLNLLLQILKHNKYDGDYKCINDYVKNRQNWFNIISDAFHLKKRDDVKKDNGVIKTIAKNLVLRITYGGSIDKWRKDWKITSELVPQKILDLQDEVKGVFKYISDANPNLHTFCKQKSIEKGKDYNHEGTTTAWFLQDKECLILEKMYEYCLDNEYIKDDICSLCNDGIMLEAEYYKPSLLDELNKFVLNKTGFDLNFVEKPLSDGYGDILDNHIIFDHWTHEISDGMYADLFKLLYHHQFICSNNCSFYYNGIYWVKDDSKKNIMINNRVDRGFKEYILKRVKAIRFNLVKDMKEYEIMVESGNPDRIKLEKKIIERFETKYYWKFPPDSGIVEHFNNLIHKIDEYHKSIERYLRNVGSRDRLVKDICRVITRDWVKFDENEYLLCFLNKVYDLKSSTFISPHYSQYISMTTGWDYINGYSSKYKEHLNSVIDKIFPNKNVKKHYLTVLATGLFGKTIQHFFIAKGKGGNGKSMLDSLMMRTIGEYGYKLPSLAVSSAIKEGANPTIANLHNKRFVLVQEPDKKHKINCSSIKELTGDKWINCRTLYSTLCVVLLALTLVMECNDLPQLDETGDAMARRIDVTPFDSRFVNQHRYDELSDEEKASGTFHIGNPYYESDNFQDQHKQALMEILFEHFKIFQANGYIMKPPKEVIECANEYLKYSDDFYGWFCDKTTKNEHSFIPFKSLWNVFSSSEFYQNMTKAQKRKFNQKHLKCTVQENMFLKNHFKVKKRLFNGIKLTSDSIVGYKLKNEYDDDDIDEECSDI